MELKIGDSLYHPCNIDIIHHKVISIRQYDGFNHYVLKAVNNVGACGKIEVIVDEHNNKFRFIELIDEENIEYASGLQDFIEGDYYINLLEAKLKFYENQRVLAWSNMKEKERLFKEAEQRFEQVKLLIDNICKDLKSEKV